MAFNFGALLKGGAAAARSIDNSRKQEKAEQMLLEDRLARKKASEAAAQRDAISLEARLRGEGYVPEAEAGPDVTTPVSGKSLDELVNSISSGPGAGLFGGLKDVTPTRYGANVGGYRYDKMSDPARLKQANVKKAERDANEPYKAASSGEPWNVSVERGVRVNPRTGEVRPIEGLPKAPEKPVNVPELSFTFKNRFDQEPSVKAAREMQDQVTMLNAIPADTPMGAGDIALIIGFNKVLDPGAIVREGDVKLAQSAASLKGRLETFVANAREGEKMDPKLRADMIAVSKQMADARIKSARRVYNDYRKQAQKYQADPDLATMGAEFLAEPKPPTPPAEWLARQPRIPQ